MIVDPDGRFRLPGAGQCSSSLHLIGRSGTGVALHTEYLIQIGAHGELDLEGVWGATSTAERRKLRRAA